MAKVYFMHGAMNAGKSLELLKTAYSYEEQHKQFLIGKSSIDTRTDTTVSTRMGESRPIDFVITPNDSYTQIAIKLDAQLTTHPGHMSVVMIDEAQFLQPDQVDNLVAYACEEHDIPLMFFGLKVDFTGHLFAGSKRIIELAEEIREIKSICLYCDRKATMNLRIDQDGYAIIDGDTVMIGGNDQYQSVCRHHYLKKMWASRQHHGLAPLT